MVEPLDWANHLLEENIRLRAENERLRQSRDLFREAWEGERARFREAMDESRERDRADT